MRLLKVGLRRQVCATTRETPVCTTDQVTDQTRKQQEGLVILSRLKANLSLVGGCGEQPDRASANA